MSKDSSPLRIGVLGAAWIAEINGYAILHQAESHCVLTAIASRSTAKAEALAAKLVQHGAAPGSIQCWGGPDAYQKLVDSKDICDAIYIPLPSALHKDWVHKVLEAGKHVLLEKPVALSADDFCDMMKTAQKCGKVLMDGTMFVHTNRTRQLVECCQNQEKMGTIQRIEGSFSFNGTEDDPNFMETNVRCQKDADPLGCVGDLGWYCVYMALLVFKATASARPVAAKVVDFQCTPDGVPIDASCIVYFEKDLKLSFYCSFRSILRQNITIVGTRKWITLDDFVLPTNAPLTFTCKSISESGKYRTFERHEEKIKVQETAFQHVLMWREFARLVVLAGTAKDDAEEYVQNSLWNQRVMDALLCSIKKEGALVEISAS